MEKVIKSAVRMKKWAFSMVGYVRHYCKIDEKCYPKFLNEKGEN